MLDETTTGGNPLQTVQTPEDAKKVEPKNYCDHGPCCVRRKKGSGIEVGNRWFCSVAHAPAMKIKS